MQEKGTIEQILESLAEIFDPLKNVLSEGVEESLILFFEQFGLSVDEESIDFNEIQNTLNITNDLIELSGIIQRLINTQDDRKEGIYNELLSKLQSTIPKIIKLKDTIDFNALPPSLDNIRNQLEKFLINLFDYLLITYIENRNPLLSRLLSLLGIFEINEIIHSEDIEKLNYTDKKICWERLKDLLVDPLDSFKEIYGWGKGEGNFKHELLLKRLEDLFLSTGLLVGRFLPDYFLLSNYYNIEALPDNLPILLKIPLFEDYDDETSAFVDISLKMLPIPAENETDNQPTGIVLVPHFIGSVGQEISMGELFVLRLMGNISSGVGLEIYPDKINLKGNLFSSDSTTAIAEIIAKLVLSTKTKERTILFGSSNGTRFEVRDLNFTIEARAKNLESVDFSIESCVKGASLNITYDEGDGFLQKILPQNGIESTFDFLIGYSSLEGLYFGGSGSIEVTIPVHKSIGPINIESIYISIDVSEKIDIKLSTSVGAKIGPVVISVQRIGLDLPITFPANSDGNLGSLNIDFPKFLPPTGAGLAVDAEGIIGGGFLEFDHENKRYTGVLALALGEISITAIGLIATKMPDGSDNFSMLVNICVQFDPPIDLSYGFTLSGIGGLIGINRTIVTEALQRGIKNRTLDSILFPDPGTVILNASKIISDMRTVFPPQEGRFIIGPMLKLGWGYPNIITGELGLFIELPPDPLRVALMGQLNAAFPDEEFGLLLINLDILGVLDTEKQELTFQASLFDSCMLSYPYVFSITGDAAFLLNWGSTPDFALSVGGFHPKFDPPPPDYIFSDLRRMQMTVTYYGIVQLTCKAYLALTTNSLQFGARVELYVSQAGFDIGGGMGFDALIYFSPFSFEVSICGYVWVEAQGISLMDIYIKAALSGPTPWNVNGEAKVQILFFDFTADFSITWGDAQKAIVAPQDPLPQVIDALSGPGNWSSRIPYKRSMVETLRSFEEHEDTPDIVIAHPSGRLEIRQNAVPFNITLKKIGNVPITGHDRFKIAGLEAGTQLNGKPNVLDTDYVKEFFARGQFEELSNAQKLSIPSFEKMDGGVTTAASQAIRFDADRVEESELTYEAILLNPDLTAERIDLVGKANWDHTKKLMAGSAARLSAKQAGTHTRFKDRNMEPKAVLEEEKYCIVNAVDLVPIELPEDISSLNLFNTRTEADQALETFFDQDPRDRDELLVVPECEVPESEVA